MAYITGILIGRITKVNGYEGGVTVKLDKIFSENIPPMESVFLEIEGRPVPFFISDWEYSGADILKLKFEGYDSVEQVSEFTGCKVFLTTGLPGDKKIDDIQVLTGFKILVNGDKLLGSVREVIPNHGQWLLIVISADNKEILIPFHEHFIVSLDTDNRILVLDLPEGLTEIN
jgi:16S rRNA processing protein RimM